MVVSVLVSWHLHRAVLQCSCCDFDESHFAIVAYCSTGATSAVLAPRRKDSDGRRAAVHETGWFINHSDKLLVQKQTEPRRCGHDINMPTKRRSLSYRTSRRARTPFFILILRLESRHTSTLFAQTNPAGRWNAQ
ncbi:uncharacterized protein B0H18DRAFT_637149 [Fomitopsis serialis]|uniref:uncharacterized protein n=1 Tax=Fomitopsis serialis TaxID=139415 RepID=UPI002007434D|nr:uncharacterized protein B0H18DRAFT_637149 [Neoantrodia serialis]KAH9919425.1 hypothetical protein B0H18DRAFT_637149 [Neoantrodia serialis]